MPLQNPFVAVVTTQRGGHISWVEGLVIPSFTKPHWHERVAIEFIQVLLESTVR